MVIILLFLLILILLIGVLIYVFAFLHQEVTFTSSESEREIVTGTASGAPDTNGSLVLHPATPRRITGSSTSMVTPTKRSTASLTEYGAEDVTDTASGGPHTEGALVHPSAVPTMTTGTSTSMATTKTRSMASLTESGAEDVNDTASDGPHTKGALVLSSAVPTMTTGTSTSMATTITRSTASLTESGAENVTDTASGGPHTEGALVHPSAVPTMTTSTSTSMAASTTRFPNTPESVDTKFNLYSMEHKDEAVEISASSPKETLKKEFGTKKSLVFTIHGFGQGEHTEMPIRIKDVFLEKINCNFVIVLWTERAKKPWYNIAAANAAFVGRHIALLLRKLTEEFPETVLSSEVHLIGFSLGAHAAGFCGRHFTLITNKTIGRITGLDPANALFTNSGEHLRPSDADFVDVIHTNRGKASSGKFGIDKICGHVDFYPNGGSKQPGCSWYSVGCSHRRSADYFVESLRNEDCKFVSYSCTNGLQDSVSECRKNESDKSEMGYYSKNALGREEQMLPTKESPPYCEQW